MRMIGIGLMGALLAGVALLLSTLNLWEKGQRYVSELTHGPQLVFETRTAPSSAGEHLAVISRSNPNHPIILSGLPSYQGVTFDMPIDARPTSGYLQIDATFQVLEKVEGVLRISIDNMRRGEMLLRSGEGGRSLQIPLSPTDFARAQLVVSFSLQGEGPYTQCRTHEGVEALVEIETTSALFLTLDRPLSSARDKVRAWGHLARIGWPEWVSPQEKLRRVLLASALQQTGVETSFVSHSIGDALKTTELREALVHFQGAVGPKPTESSLKALAASGPNSGVRRFRGKTTWRARFELGNGALTHIPVALELKLMLGHQLHAAPWSIDVVLNDQLVFQTHLKTTGTELSTQVHLPQALQMVSNNLEITAAHTTHFEGVCNEGPEMLAQMQPNTKLVSGEVAYNDPVMSLQDALQDMGVIEVGMSDALTAVDADAASRLLAQLVPQGTRLKPAEDVAHVWIVMPHDDISELLAQTPLWIVSRDAKTQRLVAEPVTHETRVARTVPALLVSTIPVNKPRYVSKAAVTL